MRPLGYTKAASANALRAECDPMAFSTLVSTVVTVHDRCQRIRLVGAPNDGISDWPDWKDFRMPSLGIAGTAR
jgi:hypothetical protein